MNIFLIIAFATIFLLGIRKFSFYISLYGFILLLSIVSNNFWNESNEYGYLPSLGLICIIIFIKEYFIPTIKSQRVSLITGRILHILRKIFFYFIFWTGIILTSMFFDKLINISEENGYLIGLILWILLVLIIEYITPYIQSLVKK